VRTTGRRALALAAWAAAGLLLGTAPPVTATVLRPQGDAEDLRRIVESARAGDVVEVPPGTWAGPLRLDRPLVLLGRGGVVDGGGRGSTIVITAPGVRIEGLEIANSGNDVGRSDACIFVAREASATVLRGNQLHDCAFGIWVNETDDVQIVDNHVRGRSELRSTDRGNGIHLFDASHVVVRGNHVEKSRDGIYISATENSLIEGNQTNDQRFGVHYMYSYDNTLRGNTSDGNVLGFALMESHHLRVEGNEARDNQREGLLFRDVQYSEIRGNLLQGNGVGMFFYSSTENEVVGNRVFGNDVGLKIWAGTLRNRIESNDIVGNRQQVFYVASEDQVWGAGGRGNHWGDYLGWDQDGDGVGDRPHRVDSFTARLVYRYPAAVLLLRSPALELLAHVTERLPLLRTPTVVDVAPLLTGANP